MSLWNGLAEVIGGIAFVFLPGAVIAYLTRRDLRYEAGTMLWGIGLSLVTLFPAIFITNLVMLLAFGDNAPPAVQAFVGSLLIALFLLGGMALLLRFRNIPDNKLLDEGLMIGLGAGIINRVFEGFGMLGHGFLMIISGDKALQDANVQMQDISTFLPGLLALVVYRLALVAVTAALGVVVARGRLEGKPLWLWLAIVLGTLTAWSYELITQILGTDTVTSIIVVIVYQGALAAVALWWLRRQITSGPPATKPIKQAAVDAALAAQQASKSDSNA
jgi:hypothetical protein